MAAGTGCPPAAAEGGILVGFNNSPQFNALPAVKNPPGPLPDPVNTTAFSDASKGQAAPEAMVRLKPTLRLLGREAMPFRRASVCNLHNEIP